MITQLHGGWWFYIGVLGLGSTVGSVCVHGHAQKSILKNRVDVNIMVDYRWPLVLKHAGAVVEGVCKASDMCDLLQGLQYINILDPTSGMYRELWGLLATRLQQVGILFSVPWWWWMAVTAFYASTDQGRPGKYGE